VNVIRIGAIGLALALVGVACGDAASTDDDTVPDLAPPASTASDSTVAGGGETDLPPLPEGPSALQTRVTPAFPEPLVDPNEIISGGPPPDGIPSIDAPEFVDVATAGGWLQPDEPVVTLDIDGQARAYPVQVLIFHEIVNDTVGGAPVAVTYCPLCNSAATYVREVRGHETTFGTSGSLFASALVMYDRATESLWTHFDGRAVVGVLAGDELVSIPSPLLAWDEFAATYPDGQVLDRERTGFERRYGANPYVGYDDPETQPFLFVGDVDARALAKRRVVGIVRDDAARAYALSAISGDVAKATNIEVGGDRLVILWKAGQSTALEDIEVAGGRDVGSVGVFLAEAEGTPVTLSAAAGSFVDDETGSTWTVTGKAVAGPLEGTQLERVPHLDTFWFAWATYRPGTELVE